ncbi:MAG: hypothetical protein U0746_15620 [Gemmataceae bacterium]
MLCVRSAVAAFAVAVVLATGGTANASDLAKLLGGKPDAAKEAPKTTTPEVTKSLTFKPASEDATMEEMYRRWGYGRGGYGYGYGYGRYGRYSPYWPYGRRW